MNFMTVENEKKNGRRISLETLLRGLALEMPSGAPGIEISGLTDDSREVIPGDLFAAIPGYKTDGRKYISEALSLGAVAVLTSPGIDLHSEIPIIITEDIRKNLAFIADRYFEEPSNKLTVAGITGTNGKTTTSYLLAGIFESAGWSWGKIGTIGYDIGSRNISSGNTTPGIINIQRYLAEMIKSGFSGCAMEVSSHALEQGRARGVRFSSATFTNLSQDHLDYHNDMESYFESKARLFNDIPLAVINIDDSYGVQLLKRASGSVITFGTGDNADFGYSCDEMNICGSLLEFRYDGLKKDFRFPLPGIFNHQNVAAAAATAVGLGLSLDEAVDGLRIARAVPGRLQPIVMGQPFAVFIDYAHTPDALEKLLTSLREFKPKKLHVVFGCGGDRDRKKRPMMGRIASVLGDHVYLTSDNPRTEDPGIIIEDTLKGMVDRKKCQVIEDRSMAIKTAISKISEGDVLVIAGKGHEDYQVVGTVKKYFSDIEVAESELRKSGYGNDGQ
ncbi:MAG: UDP-N-acetylmuramoyl-L-alanyl-D-glutamate--2,6-diaminopimelate ligase [candidate division Zixibacteria bacterium]